MIRQLLSTAVPTARSGCQISSATLKGQATQPSTWLQSKYPLNTSAHSSRLFSTTSTSRFTLTTQKSSSPFRLSSDKHDHQSQVYDDARYSQYKPKRQWPPDMSNLSPKHQFRLERKYRRRAALKYARPKFIKTVTLVQWGVIAFVAIYAVLFMDWDTKDTPFDGIRENFFAGFRGIFSTPTPPGPVKKANENN